MTSAQQDTIKNIDHLRQVTDFSSFAVRGQDIDWECDLAGKSLHSWRLEIRGRLPLHRLKKSPLSTGPVSKTAHAFFAVVQHEVDSPDIITNF